MSECASERASEWFTVVSIQSRFDISRFDTNGSCFNTHLKSIQYKLKMI